jgi:hypothetical protein
MFKKMSFVLIALVAFSASATEITVSPLKQLNQEISALLAPFQNATTQASVVFKKIKTDDVRALKLKMSGDYKMTGTANTLEVKLADLSYKYGDGTAPRTHAKAFLGFDLTKVLPQDELNQLIPQLQDLLQQSVAEYTQAYGTASKITLNITDEQKDAQGNYVSLKAVIKFSVDLDQLPASTPKNTVMISDAQLKLALDLKKGLVVDAVIISNPAYSDFQTDQTGLKEYLDKLLAQDKDTLQQFAGIVQELNSLATEVVNLNNPNTTPNPNQSANPIPAPAPSAAPTNPTANPSPAPAGLL